jgi:hypothetical protein
VIGSVEIDNEAQLKEAVEAVDGIVDVVLVDAEIRPYLQRTLASMAQSIAKQSRVLSYKVSDVWVRSVDQKIGAMLQSICGRRITVYGTDGLALKLTLSLVEQGAEVSLTGDNLEQLEAWARALRQIASTSISIRVKADPIDASRGAEVLVRFSRKEPFISRSQVEVMAPDGIVFDAGIGTVSAEAIAYGNEHGIRVVRPDTRATLAAELESTLGTQHIVGEIMGRGELSGVPVVAGGLIGRYGEIVVDSIANPSKVVGVADGRGTVIYEARPEFAEAIAKVENEIFRRKLL